MNEIKLMVGTNYDIILLPYFSMLNDKYAQNNVRIAEVYGSIRAFDLFGTARPTYRVPDIPLNDFISQVNMFRQNNIGVNYTDNTPIVVKNEININKLKRDLVFMSDIGITRITVAHPLAMELISKYSDIPIEVSTIYRANTAYQIRELLRRAPNINKICLDVAQNRNYELIKKLVKEGITIELLANELCITNCADRVQCYNEHAQTATNEDSAMFKRYPIGNCTTLRYNNPVEWTRARFILPQSMEYYGQYGIDHFKITGRTHPTRYIKWITEQYMKRNFTGNLVELWADVKDISRVSKGKDHLPPMYEIDSGYYEDGFLMAYENNKLDDIDTEYKYLTYLLNQSLKQ